MENLRTHETSLFFVVAVAVLGTEPKVYAC